MKTNSLKAWLLAARPKTLSGAAVPVMIGLALAYNDAQQYDGEVFKWGAALLCLFFSFAMQIDANFINDFYDFAKGTDDVETRLGPRRACAQGWVTLDAMKKAIAITTIIACLIGLPLALYGGMEMILIGILCVLFAFLYTTFFSYLGLGDVLVLIFFGLIPVSCTYYVQLHEVTWQVLIASTACGLVIDALLLVNNFRDRDNLLGGVFLMNGHYLAFLLPLIYLALHIVTFLKMKRIYQGKALNLILGETARNIFIYGLLVSLGILLV